MTGSQENWRWAHRQEQKSRDREVDEAELNGTRFPTTREGKSRDDAALNNWILLTLEKSTGFPLQLYLVCAPTTDELLFV